MHVQIRLFSSELYDTFRQLFCVRINGITNFEIAVLNIFIDIEMSRCCHRSSILVIDIYIIILS